MTLLKRHSTFSSCGWCATFNHDKCYSSESWPCQCRIAEHRPTPEVVRYQAAYLQLSPEDIREAWAERLGSKPPVDDHSPRGPIADNMALPQEGEHVIGTRAGEARIDDTGLTSASRAKAAEDALAAFTGHGRVGKL